MQEIGGLEEELADELKKFEKKVGYVIFYKWTLIIGLINVYRCSLTYWHSAQGTKVCHFLVLIALKLPQRRYTGDLPGSDKSGTEKHT